MMRLDFWTWPVDFQYGCPLWVISGHRPAVASCPLCPQKRTFVSAVGMSA